MSFWKKFTNKKAKFNQRGQSSIEFLIVISFGLLILIPALVIFFNYSKTTNDQVVSNQINLIGNEIMGAAEEMHVIGPGSWVTLDVSFPTTFDKAVIRTNGGEDLVFHYSSPGGMSQAVFFPQRFNFKTGPDLASLDGDDAEIEDLGPGTNRIRIEATDSGDIWIRSNVLTIPP